MSVLKGAGLALLLLGATTVANGQVTTASVNYEVEWTDGRGPFRKISIPGTLRLPAAAGARVPAVVILHSAGGIDGTGHGHAVNFNQAGFATLEIDMFRPRGRSDLGSIRQHHTMPDVFGALDFLAAHPSIDPARIAVTGYSYGGSLAILALSDSAARNNGSGKHHFAAHIAYYPVCYFFGNQLGGRTSPFWGDAQGRWTGKPLLIVAGAQDQYEGPDTCEKLKESLPEANRAVATVHTYPDAGHGFDVPRGRTYRDEFACFGKGCTVSHTGSPTATADAYRLEVDFLRKALGLGG